LGSASRGAVIGSEIYNFKMRAVIQRVTSGSVVVDNQQISKIERGLVILVGVKQGDSTRNAEYIARKIAETRILKTTAGKWT